jgi:4-hydroxythreonine-4-phosphate dehydrogenase
MLGKIKLGISMGDPNGIGIEIILKIFEDKRLFDFFTPVVYAPYKLLDQQKKQISLCKKRSSAFIKHSSM